MVPIKLVHLRQVTSHHGPSGLRFFLGLTRKGLSISGRAQEMTMMFKTTSGVVYKPVVIRGEYFSGNTRTTKNIRRVAKNLRLVTPPVELAGLLREKMSDEEIGRMGFEWLVVMHSPLSKEAPELLMLCREEEGNESLDTYEDDPSHRWWRNDGFVFLAPQK